MSSERQIAAQNLSLRNGKRSGKIDGDPFSADIIDSQGAAGGVESACILRL